MKNTMPMMMKIRATGGKILDRAIITPVKSSMVQSMGAVSTSRNSTHPTMAAVMWPWPAQPKE